MNKRYTTTAAKFIGSLMMLGICGFFVLLLLYLQPPKADSLPSVYTFAMVGILAVLAAVGTLYLSGVLWVEGWQEASRLWQEYRRRSVMTTEFFPRETYLSFVNGMGSKLQESCAVGWDTLELQRLVKGLRYALARCDYTSAANYCMMLEARWQASEADKDELAKAAEQTWKEADSPETQAMQRHRLHIQAAIAGMYDASTLVNLPEDAANRCRDLYLAAYNNPHKDTTYEQARTAIRDALAKHTAAIQAYRTSPPLAYYANIGERVVLFRDSSKVKPYQDKGYNVTELRA